MVVWHLHGHHLSRLLDRGELSYIRGAVHDTGDTERVKDATLRGRSLVANEKLATSRAVLPYDVGMIIGSRASSLICQLREDLQRLVIEI